MSWADLPPHHSLCAHHLGSRHSTKPGRGVNSPGCLHGAGRGAGLGYGDFLPWHEPWLPLTGFPAPPALWHGGAWGCQPRTAAGSAPVPLAHGSQGTLCREQAGRDGADGQLRAAAPALFVRLLSWTPKPLVSRPVPSGRHPFLFSGTVRCSPAVASGTSDPTAPPPSRWCSGGASSRWHFHHGQRHF